MFNFNANFRFHFLLLSLVLGFSMTSFAGEWVKIEFQQMLISVYLPNGYSSSNKNALMINLHGCSQKAEFLRQEGNWESAADQFHMIVAIPSVPAGGVLMGCWDYYGEKHSVDEDHTKFLISLINELIKKTEFNINSKKIFISGLSSGAGEAALLACLRPDLISGIALNSTPAIGTNPGDVQSPPPDSAGMVQLCKKWSTDKISDLLKLKVAIIYGENDPLMDPSHNKAMGEVYKNILSLKNPEVLDTNYLPGVSQNTSGLIFKNQKGFVRQVLLSAKDLGHNWAAGPLGKSGGEGFAEDFIFAGTFISHKSVNYPYFMAQFFLAPLF